MSGESMRGFARHALSLVERRYRRRHQLAPCGPMLHVGRSHYDGPPLRLPDGTEVPSNVWVGTLHFDNLRIADLSGSERQRVVRFARLLRESLGTLADHAVAHPEFRLLRAYRGITWLPSHGERVGFLTTPLPDDWRARRVKAYLRMLRWAFKGTPLADGDADPRTFWLTRTALLEHFGQGGRGRVA